MKFIRSLTLLLCVGVALSCGSLSTEMGVEVGSVNTVPMPYLQAKCYIPLEFLSYAIPQVPQEDGEEVPPYYVISTWLVPEVHLNPDVEMLWARTQLLVDVPWPGQFGLDANVSLHDYRLAVFYRQSW